MLASNSNTVQCVVQHDGSEQRVYKPQTHIEKGPVAPLEAWFSYFFLYKKETFYTLQHCLPFQFQLKWDENILLRALTAFQWHHLELLSLLWHWDLKSFQPTHVFDRQYWISKVKYTFSCLYTQCNFCTFNTNVAFVVIFLL